MDALAKENVTADELSRLPSNGYRYELGQGVLGRRALADKQHGELAVALGWRLAQFVSEHGLGDVYAAETGFKLRADTVRAPDAAFVSRARLEDAPTGKGYCQGPPDLTVEVVSPNDRPPEVAEKVYEWLFYGTAEVRVLDPERRSVTVYRPGEDLRILGEQNTLRSPLLPGWALLLSELFA